eukprot:TRINITY_DN5269_c0_g1_i1.p1 TRINITY_DN5269_c0_g1~~TRINITY_DN5269_c0_g1_i1.p1  ORF type:complete len:168 (-),score=61.68 TRINITY_DN5269_c0_g1_i1:45-548(-)
MSLTRILKEHQAQQVAIKEENDILRKKAMHSVSAFSVAMLESVNGGVSQCYRNQRDIEREAKLLQSEAHRFSTQTAQWLSLVDNFNTALKEMGDVENWAKNMEQDMHAIVKTLEFIHKNENVAEEPTAVATEGGVTESEEDGQEIRNEIAQLEQVPADSAAASGGKA